MKPFVAGLLKCNKCESTELPHIAPTKIQKIDYKGTTPSISDYINKQDYLLNLLSSMSELKDLNFDLSEADIYTFCETEGNEGSDAVIKLLFMYDIIEGSLICSNQECQCEHQIKDSILRY